jgi:hypothetical protein
MKIKQAVEEMENKEIKRGNEETGKKESSI